MKLHICAYRIFKWLQSVHSNLLSASFASENSYKEALMLLYMICNCDILELLVFWYCECVLSNKLWDFFM